MTQQNDTAAGMEQPPQSISADDLKAIEQAQGGGSSESSKAIEQMRQLIEQQGQKLDNLGKMILDLIAINQDMQQNGVKVNLG